MRTTRELRISSLAWPGFVCMMDCDGVWLTVHLAPQCGLHWLAALSCSRLAQLGLNHTRHRAHSGNTIGVQNSSLAHCCEDRSIFLAAIDEAYGHF